MSEKKSVVQKIWGVALLLAGVGMFFTIPSKVSEIKAVGGYSNGQMIFLRICFYIMSLVLTLGGGRKLYNHFGLKKDVQDNADSE